MESESSNNSRESVDSLNEDDLQVNYNDYIKYDASKYNKDPLPDYHDLFPPSFKESFYYPIVKIRFAENYDLEESKSESELEEEKAKKKKELERKKFSKYLETNPNTTNNHMEQIVEIKSENIPQKIEELEYDTHTLWESFSKLNIILEQTKNEIIKYKSEKKKITSEMMNKKNKKKNPKLLEEFNKNSEKLKNTIQNVIPHKITDLREENISINNSTLNEFRNLLCVDLFNTKDKMNKYIKLVTKE
jgi:hypothetical protein